MGEGETPASESTKPASSGPAVTEMLPATEMKSLLVASAVTVPVPVKSTHCV
jgi:hypothetical protein